MVDRDRDSVLEDALEAALEEHGFR